MPSNKKYLAFIQEQLSGLDGVSYRPMMGEYLIYVQGRHVGGIYDDRLLLKPTKAAKELLPDAPIELPYEGAKPMVLADCIDDRFSLQSLVCAIAAEIPDRGK
mgnify:CR=1 FL=1